MKKYIHNSSTKNLTFFLLMVIALSACQRPVIIITDIPENTPKGSSIYIAGNFNRWDPGDVRFRFELLPDSNFTYTLPRGFGRVEYKITRGEWSMVETDVCGYDINNRAVPYTDGDTTIISVLSWKDTPPVNCPELVIVVDKLPKNTPPDDPIALAGNFNDWLPDSTWHLQPMNGSSRYFINLPRPENGRTAEFKITRGSLLTAEADALGYEREIRRVVFGQMDTLRLTVESWEDLAADTSQKLTIILEKIPANTPPDDKIFLTGTFNGWYPRDNKYLFTENSRGLPEITIPKKADEIEFKITRGDWSKEEVDISGFRMNNRVHKFDGLDTMRISIAGWVDMTQIKQPEFTIAIVDIPDNTPPDDDLYFTSNINRWNPGQRSFRFKNAPDGNYYLTLRDTPASVQFKITRGSWSSEEADEYGYPLSSRNFLFDGGDDTLFITIKNWKDIINFEQQQVVILVDDVPDSTPKDANIYLAGSFNNWNPKHPDYILNKNLKDHYYITLPTSGADLYFKFTLGGWQREELDASGETISNRIYRPGYADTIRLKIENWRGME
jgi:hypothetical protein